MFDAVAKEIFFLENVLFLEGQEDVGLLRSRFDPDIQIFGYGVRGYKNFEFAFELPKDLGIKKALAIIDSPENTEQTNENDVKKSLEKKYISQGYKVVQWNKSDIRDKKKYISNRKIGYFDERGQLKGINELDDFTEKIKAVNNYFHAN